MYTFSVIVSKIIPNNVKCIHSATKFRFRDEAKIAGEHRSRSFLLLPMLVH